MINPLSQTLSSIFECHGGQELDTPVFELRDILSGKYGEDSKLIYNLEDQGGEICSLRYDLTVPFARWLAMNSNVAQVSRYHISKVYRRDQPAMSKGRYREFYQCDFDIAGEYEPMIPDAEALLITSEAFDALKIDVTVKLNHRRILDGIFSVAGVPAEKIRSISSAVDKLDKISWEDVKKEMTEQKGLEEGVADQIGEFVRNRGSLREMLGFLEAKSKLMQNEDIKSGVEDIALLVSYLEAYGIADKISFDLSLARGLDYYTGLIYEIITELPNSKAQSKNKKQEIQVGSIAAGGRYDNLVGMYGNRTIPCVGVSFGVDRIYTILDARQPKSKGSQPGPDVDVYVIAAGSKEDGLLLERMRVTGQLTKAGIRASFMRKANPKLVQQFKAAKNVPITIILGAKELAAGNVRLKVSSVGQEANTDGPAQEKEENDRGQLVSRESLIEEVKKLLKL